MRFLKADRLFDGRDYLADNTVLVLDDHQVLKDIIAADKVGNDKIERLEGVITPGFVNVHCHLELSHLKGSIPEHTGLPAFAGKVISTRNAMVKEERAEHMQQADRYMWEKGIVATGDISNTDESFAIKASGKVYYHTFVELIGLNPVAAGMILEKGSTVLNSLRHVGLEGSLAPHAPYSTSKELIRLIGEYNARSGAILSIHNQESEEETRFFKGEKNGFDDLYTSLGLDLSWYKAPGVPSLLHYLDALPAEPSLLIHNTFTGSKELDAVKNRSIFWGFCPGANLYIENRLPDLSVFGNSKNRICIGTDSLASNSQLDVVAEANLILGRTNVFSLDDLLRALTSNGAEALGLRGKFGGFITGKNVGLNLLQLQDSKIRFHRKIA